MWKVSIKTVFLDVTQQFVSQVSLLEDLTAKSFVKRLFQR